MRTLIMSLALAGTVVLGGLPAQTKALSKQEQATRAFEQLTVRMQKLRVALKATDPDKAEVLKLGSQFIQEKALTAKMQRIEELLQEESWDDAIEECRKVIKDLNTLINLLLKGDTRIEDILKEIQRLEGFKQAVEKLIADERGEKQDSAQVEALEQHLKNLEKARRNLEDLIADQKDVRGETNQAGLAPEPGKAKKLSDRESSLKDRAEKLADDLAQLERDAAELDANAAKGKPGEGKPGQGQPGEGKPGEGKPGEGKPGESKPGQGQPGEGKPGESKPGGGQPGEGQPGEGKPGDGSPGDGQAGKPGKGSSAASGASQDMGKAAGKLQDNRPESSLEDMDRALEKLEAAKKEIEDKIEEARRQLLKLPFEQLARKQEETKIETDKLAEEMEKSESEPGEGQGKPTPGRQNVQQSVPKMKSAAGSLKEYKAGKAKQDQQDAQDKLEEAKKKLEDALAQLRQQLQDEVLRSLEERFGAMLAKQKKISAKTRLIDAQKKESVAPDGDVSSVLKTRTETQATGEFELSAEAHASLKLLEEDGTTAVFPDFVIELREDLKAVGKRLNEQKTGKATQTMQREIEDMIEMLIDALRQQIEQNEANGGEP